MNHSPFIIKEITALETYAVRHPVLRPGRPIQDCKFDNDNAVSTFHLGLYYSEKLVGVVTFMQIKNEALNQNNQFQLRGMAVLEEFRGLHFGKALIKHGENIAKAKNAELIWLNAREIAIPFYKHNGYNTFGSAFNIQHIGLHYSMYKTIKNN